MQLNNIAALTTLAVLSSVNAYDAFWWDNAANTISHADNGGVAHPTVQNCIDDFNNNHQWPAEGSLNTALGFKKFQRQLFEDVTRSKIIAFAQTPNRYIMKQLSKKVLEDMARKWSPVPAAGAPALSPKRTTCNNALATIFENSLPKNWPSTMPQELVESIINIHASVAQIRKINPALLKEYPGSFMYTFARDPRYFPVLATKSIMAQLMKHTVACQQLTPDAFKYVARNSDAAKYIDGKAFNDMIQVHAELTCGRFVRFLPKGVFEYLSHPLLTDPTDPLSENEGFTRFASPEQIRNWQAKTIKDHNVFLDIALLNRHQCEALPVKVYMKYFEQAKSDPFIQASLPFWRFWKHLPTKVLKELLEEIDVASLIPAEAFKAMTSAQRQLILDAGDKDNNTDCSKLPKTILKGKKKRLVGLHASKKCFEALGDDGAWIFRALVLDMFEGKMGGKISANAVGRFSTTLRRSKKQNADGKMVSRPDLELTGVLAMEALQHKSKGPEFVKAFFNHKDKDVLEATCRPISMGDLRKTKWIQTMMSKACIKHLTVELDDAKRLHPNIWANMSKDQIKGLFKDNRDGIKELDGPFVEGLAANKHFAARTCKPRTKENKDGDDVDRKPELALIKPSVRSQYFGSKYINALPDDADCMKTVAAYVASLSDSCMAGVTAAWASKNKNVIDALRPEQYGRISDDLDAETFPASLNAANVMGMSNDRVSHLSGKFLSHMTPSGLSYFSAEQVKLIPADSLTLLCGDKATAIKHELSEAQKAALGKDCPAAEGSMAPTNAHIGAFTAAAALAAGSLALLI